LQIHPSFEQPSPLPFPSAISALRSHRRPSNLVFTLCRRQLPSPILSRIPEELPQLSLITMTLRHDKIEALGFRPFCCAREGLDLFSFFG
jgi:hypothetical protein